MINNYKVEEGGSAKIVIDKVQTQLECCGYDDMLDWRPEEVAIIGQGVSRDNVTIRDQDWLDDQPPERRLLVVLDLQFSLLIL